MDCQTETNKVLNTYINIFVDYIQMITFTTLYLLYMQFNSIQNIMVTSTNIICRFTQEN